MTNAGEDVEKKESLCTAGGNADCAATVEKSMKFPMKVKNGTSI